MVKCKKKNPFEFEINMTNIRNGWKKVQLLAIIKRVHFQIVFERFQVAYTFRSYGPGVRYIMFIHCGKDTQYWAGHFGSKMAGARVEIPLHVLQDLQIKKSTESI